MGNLDSPVGEWDVTVPSSGAELLAELRRHGVLPGRRLRVRVVDERTSASTASGFRGSLAEFPEPSWEDFDRAAAAARDDFGLT